MTIQPRSRFGFAGGLAAFAALFLVAPLAGANQYVGDLVYCDVAGEAGVYEPALGDYGIDGVEVQIDCIDVASQEACGSFTTTTGALDQTVDNPFNFFDSEFGCRDYRTFGADDLTGRYVVNVFDPADVLPGSECRGTTQCTVTPNPATLPTDCSTIVTPIVDSATPAGDVPADGNADGDYCDPEDGAFAEGQILGNNSASQATCEAFASPGPMSTGTHVAVTVNPNTRCSLYNDFGYTPGGACELEVETFCSVADTSGLECEAKIAAFEMIYTGPDMLGADVEVSGKADGLSQYDDVDLVSGFVIAVDARPEDLGSKTTISINGVEEVIHTSCSVPFVAGMAAPLDNPKGDPSPNWMVQSFVDKHGASSSIGPIALAEDCTITPSSSNTKKKKKKKSKKKAAQSGGSSSNLVDYTYVISNPGSQSAFDVVAIDDVYGELEGSPIDEIASGESVTLMQTEEVTETVTNTVYVSGASSNGGICEAQSSTTVTVDVPPVSCADGKPQALVFEYTGDSCEEASNTQNKDECEGDPDGANDVSIVITRDANDVSASPASGLNVGDLVTISTRRSKLKSRTELDIVGGAETQSLNIHTSCSDDLIVGQSFGALRLVEFIPED